MESAEVFQLIRVALIGATLIVVVLEAILWAVRKRVVHGLGLAMSLLGATILLSRWINYGTSDESLVLLTGTMQWSALFFFGGLIPIALRRAAESSMTRTTWLTFAIGLCGGVGAWISDLVLTDQIVSIVELTGQLAHAVLPTSLAVAFVILILVGIAVELTWVVRADFDIAGLAWRGLITALGFVALGAVNDLLMVLGVIETVGLIDVGLALSLVSVVGVVAANTASAYSELEDDVAAKTAELADTVSSLRDLLSGMPDLMLLYRDGDIELVNARARAWLGQGLLTIDDLGMEETDRSKLRKLFESASETPEYTRVVLKTNEGPEPVDIVGISLLLDGEKRVVANARPTRERDEYERRLRLADRLSSLGTMAAGIAHEINNPVAYVAANVEFCLEELRDEPDFDEERDALVASLKGTTRIAKIVKDLAAFSRLEDSSEWARADVNRAVELAVSISKSSIRHRVELEVDVPESIPDAQCDTGQLSQVLINLLINASDAMPPDRPRTENLVRLEARSEEEAIVIRIEDNGSGMSPRDAERIFDPFFTTKEVGAGTGLGLSVSHSIIESAKGTIDVSSAIGKGTIFTIRFPIATAQDGIAKEPSDPSEIPELNVLLIDDDPFIRRAAARLLSFDHVISAVASAEEAIETIEQSNFDIILCDVMMPTMNGVEFRDWLATNRPELSERFLFFTGGAVGDDLLDRVEKSGSPVLRKPFDRRSFRHAVQQLRAVETEKTGRPESPDGP